MGNSSVLCMGLGKGKPYFSKGGQGIQKEIFGSGNGTVSNAGVVGEPRREGDKTRPEKNGKSSISEIQ